MNAALMPGRANGFGVSWLMVGSLLVIRITNDHKGYSEKIPP
jgi:hypothetical protein